MKENLEEMNKKFDEIELRIFDKVNEKIGEYENKLFDLEIKQIQLQREISANDEKLEDQQAQIVKLNQKLTQMKEKVEADTKRRLHEHQGLIAQDLSSTYDRLKQTEEKFKNFKGKPKQIPFNPIFLPNMDQSGLKFYGDKH